MTATGTGLDIGYFILAEKEIEQYRFCSIRDRKIFKTKLGEDSDGVSQDDYYKDCPVLLRYFGFTQIKCGGEISSGDYIASDENGCAIKADANQVILGKALESGSKGQIIEVYIQKNIKGK